MELEGRERSREEEGKWEGSLFDSLCFRYGEVGPSEVHILKSLGPGEQNTRSWAYRGSWWSVLGKEGKQQCFLGGHKTCFNL